MYARLGFSVAAHVDPEVLLVDEVLSVGDFAFQRRCMERMREVLRQGTALVFVSHNLRAVADLCDRSLLLERGRVVDHGETAHVVQTYLSRALSGRRDTEGHEVYVSRVVLRGDGGERSSFRSGERAWVDIDITARRPCDRLSITLYAEDETSRLVFNTSTERLGLATINLGAGESFHCSVQLDLHLAPGTYHVGVALFRYDIQHLHDQWFPAVTLLIAADRDVRGVANLYPRVVAFEPGPAPVPAGGP
jgi:hypothetical protein